MNKWHCKKCGCELSTAETLAKNRMCFDCQMIEKKED